MKQPHHAASTMECPSAPPAGAGATVYGVVAGAPEARRIAYLTKRQPVTPQLLGMAGSVEPDQVFRAASPCMQGACRHFAGGDCTLAQRIVATLDPVVDGLPPCQIRKTCVWFHQEGKAACLRCPQVVTRHSSDAATDRWIDGGVE